jgi:hypothetical protein
MHTATSFCLYNLAQSLADAKIENKLFVSTGTLIVNQRHELVKAAQEWSATHVLFIDSDMEFTPDCVTTLLDRKLPVVAAAYSKRVEPFIATAWHEIGNWNSHVTEFDDDVIECQAVATGFMLIDIAVFDQLPLPWFKLGWYNNQYVGEDIEFCRMLMQHNIPLHLDLSVSKQLGHIGSKSYKIDPDA